MKEFNQIKIGNCMINTLLIWYYLLVIFNMIFNIILYRILFRILFQNINMILICYDFEKKNPINWRDAVALALRNGSPTPVWSPKGDVYLWLLHRASNLAKGTDRLRAALSGWMESCFVPLGRCLVHLQFESRCLVHLQFEELNNFFPSRGFMSR